MSSIKPSPEQTHIIDLIKNDKSVYCNASAGSGKTSTVLWIAKFNPTKKIVQITYNASLRIEVSNKAENNKLSNLKVENYHTLAIKYLNSECYTDEKLRYHLDKAKQGSTVEAKHIELDLLIIDEVQDLNLLYFELIYYLYGKLNCQLLLLGDINQTVYDYKGSNHNFLTDKSIWYLLTKQSLEYARLNQSFRITKPISDFINNHMVSDQRIYSNKNGPPVSYINCNLMRSGLFLLKIIKQEMKQHNLLPDDIFIICASIKGKNTPASKLENILTKNKIPCFVPSEANSKLDYDVIKGKVVFTTFHQSKGRERKFVIILGFDNSYFTYFAKDKQPNICPDTLYVGVTRCSYKLILVADEKQKPLPFIRDINSNENLQVIFKSNSSVIDSPHSPNEKRLCKTSSTELIRHLDISIMRKWADLVDECLLESELQYLKTKTFDQKTKINTKNNLIEDVSKLLIQTIIRFWFDPHYDCNSIIKEANKYLSNQSGYHNKLYQIDNHDWVDPLYLVYCKNILDQIIKSSEAKINLLDSIDVNFKDIKINIAFSFDISSNNTSFYKIYNHDNISLENKIEFIINSYLCSQKNPKGPFGMYETSIINIKKYTYYEFINNPNNTERIKQLLDESISFRYITMFKNSQGVNFCNDCWNIISLFFPKNLCLLVKSGITVDFDIILKRNKVLQELLNLGPNYF